MSRDRSESGFTMVELLVATVVSSIIIGAIAGILIVTLRTYPQSAAKLTVSDNAQLLSSWLVPDVQSAGGSAGDIQTSPSVSGCQPPSGVPAKGKLQLSWQDLSVAETTYTADYCLVGSELIRYYAVNGDAVSQTV